MGIEAIMALGGMVLPPAVNLVKSLFGKNEQGPDATASTLATTSPEVLPDFVDAQGRLTKSKAEWFNRDVIGQPSQWIVDLRAAIRPASTVLAIFFLAADGTNLISLDHASRGTLAMIAGNWVGSKIRIS